MKLSYNFINKLIKFISKVNIVKKILHPLYVISGIKVKRVQLRNEIYQKKAPLLIKKFKQALDKHNVEFWLEFGTLLGVYRENNFLKHDLDIDVGVMATNYSKELESTLSNYGFKLIKEYIIEDGKIGREQTYEFENVTIDIFYFYEKENNICCHAFVPFKDLKEDDSILKYGGLLPLQQYLPIVKLKTIQFLGSNYSIPKNTKEHLAYHYGEDFMTPNISWNFKDIENDNKNAEYLYDKIGVMKSF